MWESLPSRGAWIEICDLLPLPKAGRGRSPHGERGLKYKMRRTPPGGPGRRSPHGERGLKYADLHADALGVAVAPLTGSVD